MLPRRQVKRQVKLGEGRGFGEGGVSRWWWWGKVEDMKERWGEHSPDYALSLT